MSHQIKLYHNIGGWWWSNEDIDVRNTAFLCVMREGSEKSTQRRFTAWYSAFHPTGRYILLSGVPVSVINGLLKQSRASLSNNSPISIKLLFCSLLKP